MNLKSKRSGRRLFTLSKPTAKRPNRVYKSRYFSPMPDGGILNNRAIPTSILKKKPTTPGLSRVNSGKTSLKSLKKLNSANVLSKNLRLPPNYSLGRLPKRT